MSFARSLVSGLVLAATVAAHPTGTSPDAAPLHYQLTGFADKHAHRRAHIEAERDVTVYDAAVTAPTVVPDERIVFLDDANHPTGTTTEDVVVLPATMSGETPCPTTTVLTSMSTATVTVVPVAATGAPAAAPEIMLEGDSSVAASPPAGAAAAVGGGAASPESPVVVPTTLPAHKAPSSDDAEDSDSAPAPSGQLRAHGVSYAPYRSNHQCKSEDDIKDDFSRFIQHYSVVRIYGTDCDQVNLVYRAAKAAGTKMFLGIWDLDQVENEARMIIDGVNSDWDMVHTVSVGNELVNSGQATPDQVVQAVNQARHVLRGAGYKGPVVAVDTFIATENNPQLCHASDYCAMNAHPFFDSTVSADGAGRWLANTVQRVKGSLAGSKNVVVTETGWPTAGEANGMAVPSLANQKKALASISEAFSDHPGDVILFSAFNDLWKVKDMATFNADQFWGIDGMTSTCDQ